MSKQRSHCSVHVLLLHLLVGFIVLNLFQDFRSQAQLLPEDEADTISSGQALNISQTLISKGGKFELGFFRPVESPNYYIGIWHKQVSVQNKVVVWVANRDDPVTDYPYSPELKLLENGSLALLYESRIVWSIKSTSNAIVSSEAVLGDDGNFVLRTTGVKPSDIIWQSFDYPTDALLPGAKIGYDSRSNKLLTSWKTPYDPAKGLYSLQLDREEDTFYFLSDQNRYWSSGAWNGTLFSLAPQFGFLNFSYVKNENESYFTYNVYNSSITSVLMMDVAGQIQQLNWVENSQSWIIFWSLPKSECEVYNYCGAYGVCNQRSLPLCRCLDGFEPRSPHDWNLETFSGGCVMKTYLRCGDEVGFLEDRQQYGVINQQSNNAFKTADDCKKSCLNNCSCTAYAFKTTCLLWKTNVLDIIPPLTNDSEVHLYLRVATSEIPRPVSGNGNGENNTTGRNLIIIVISTIVFVVLVSACIWIIMRKRKQKKRERDIMNESETSMEISIEESLRFDFDTIKVATDDFSDTNKLGQGGFGAVYKGRLPEGRDVAVKRLSQTSKQGELEFKNEVLLMANLQHRNLVRLLGFCLHGKERLLIYEFIPNTSLDHFIFDPKKSGLLDGDMRYKIIVGIARGLMYLHEDSRVRIIHRDLKTSNILLDAAMQPKIADFGMARIFDLDENENQASTQRIVGTYGYMAPEYAMFGQFSVKSDVFSFGVLVLEILSGQKNNQRFENEGSVKYLLSHAWKNWQEGTHSNFIDPTFKDGSFSLSNIMRCIHIGLLCVQEKVVDRPTMAAVVNMFNNVSLALQIPTEPAFFGIYPQSSQVDIFKCEDSVNEASITEVSGR